MVRWLELRTLPDHFEFPAKHYMQTADVPEVQTRFKSQELHTVGLFISTSNMDRCLKTSHDSIHLPPPLYVKVELHLS